MRAAFLASLFLAAYACGADKSASSDAPAGDQPGDKPIPGTDGAEVPYSLAVPNDAALPPCDEASKYRLVFVQDQAVFKSCSGSAWSVIDVKGKDGEAGKDGADGKEGTDNRIVASILCGGDIASTTLAASYSGALMASGDVFATADEARLEGYWQRLDSLLSASALDEQIPKR